MYYVILGMSLLPCGGITGRASHIRKAPRIPQHHMRTPEDGFPERSYDDRVGLESKKGPAIDLRARIKRQEAMHVDCMQIP